MVFSDYPTKVEVINCSDRKRRERLLPLAEKVAIIGKEFCKTEFLSYPSCGNHGIEPPEIVWRVAFGERIYNELQHEGLLARILNKDLSSLAQDIYSIIQKYKADIIDAVIALSNFSTSHTIFRDLVTRGGARYASMPLFEETMLYGPMMIDWEAMKARTEKLADEMKGGIGVEIEAPNGTGLTLSFKGRKVMTDTGIITEPGSFSNLPAGEVFLAPLEGTGEGILVLEWAPTFKLNSKVFIEVKDGVVKRLKGVEPYRHELEKMLTRDKDFGNIAELGIGTNEKAKRPDNILESEKILGTIHIALGDNSSFGGKVRASFHQDFIVFKPTVKILKPSGERKVIIKEGKFLFSLGN